MEFKSHANKIYNFLKRHENIWRYEIMDTYPESLNVIPEEWINELWELDLKSWHDFESKRELKNCKSPSLQQFITEIKELLIVPQLNNIEIKEQEDWAYKDVKFKKRHEINLIAPYLKSLQNKYDIKKLIDIGGGVGHLSRIVAYYYQIPSLSIDKEVSFQKTGIDRLKRYRKPPGGAEVEFYNVEYSNNEIENLKQKVSKDSFTLGLHTCGELAVEVLDTSIKLENIGLLSFGCCYHKLHNKNKFPISQYYKENTFIDLSLYALTLASRAHGQTNYEEFVTKYLVKNFRQGLHLYLYHQLELKKVFDVGEIHVRNYRGSFEDYVLGRLQYLKIDRKVNREEIKHFYEDSETQRLLKKMFIQNLIRWQIGRVLEIYILLDRVIYCEEKNYKAAINTFFDEAISPRNIGITAIRPGTLEDTI